MTKGMTKEDFLRRAIALARECSPAAGDRPFGAVIVKDGVIVGEGRNVAGSGHDPTAHSEIMAIRDACARLAANDLAGAEIYTSGEPCPMCAGAIWWAKLDRIVYAASSADAVALGLGVTTLAEDIRQPIGARSIPAEQLLAAEAVAVMSAWAEAAREEP